jgi:hypothetical protein
MAGLKKTKKQQKSKDMKKRKSSYKRRSTINNHTKRNVKILNKLTRKLKQVGGDEIAQLFGLLKDRLTLLNGDKYVPSHRVDVEAFDVLYNSNKKQMEEEIENLLIDDPLLFISNCLHLIDKSVDVYKEDIAEDKLMYVLNNIQYNYMICNFLSEFYEGDPHVYDDDNEIVFDNLSVQTLIYLCINHLCYIANELVKTKLMKIYNSFILNDIDVITQYETQEYDGVPGEFQGPLNLEQPDGVPGEFQGPLNLEQHDGVPGEFQGPLNLEQHDGVPGEFQGMPNSQEEQPFVPDYAVGQHDGVPGEIQRPLNLEQPFVPVDYVQDVRNLLGYINDENYYILVQVPLLEEQVLPEMYSDSEQVMYVLNPDKINLHDPESMGTIREKLFNVYENKDYSFLEMVDVSHPTYREIVSIDYTLQLTLYRITEFMRFIDSCVNPGGITNEHDQNVCDAIFSMSPFMRQKLSINCNHTMTLINEFNISIAAINKRFIEKYRIYDDNALEIKKWIFDLAQSLTTYDNISSDEEKFILEFQKILQNIGLSLDGLGVTIKDIYNYVYSKSAEPMITGNPFEIQGKQKSDGQDKVSQWRLEDYKNKGERTLEALRIKRREKETERKREQRELKANTRRRNIWDEDDAVVPSIGGNRIPFNLRGGFNDDDIMNLILGHVVYDNSHDFDFEVDTGPECVSKCQIPIVTAEQAIKWYFAASGMSIVGKESVAKAGMKNILKQHFSGLICEKSFDVTNANALEDIQEHINRVVFNVDSLPDYADNNSLFFYYDQGGYFTKLMLKNEIIQKTSKSGDKGKKKKESGESGEPGEDGSMKLFQQTSFLKSWDSSSGGRFMGNAALRTKIYNIIKTNGVQDPRITRLNTAFNIHSFMSMSHYFETFKDYIYGLFVTNDTAVVPILQSSKMNIEGKMDLYITFVKLSDCINIRNDIIKAQETTVNPNDLLGDLIALKVLKANYELNTNKYTALTYDSMVYKTESKFSVNAILTGVGLDKGKRTGETKKGSTDKLNAFFNNKVFTNLKPEKIKSYGFMVKHSGDQCQSYQTQKVNTHIYEIELNRFTDNKQPVTHILYTEDILAFCNGVFNSSNVFTITMSGNMLSVLSSPISDIEMTQTLIDEINATALFLEEYYENVVQETKDVEYINKFKAKMKFFISTIDNVLDSIKTPPHPDDKLANDTLKTKKIELIKFLKQFNAYINNMQFLEKYSEYVSNNNGITIKRFPDELNEFKTQMPIESEEHLTNILHNAKNSVTKIFIPNKVNIYRVYTPSTEYKLYDGIKYIFRTTTEQHKDKFITDLFGSNITIFNKLIEHLESVLRSFIYLQTDLITIQQNEIIYNLFNTKQMWSNFKQINDDLYSNVNLIKKSLETGVNAEASNTNKVVVQINHKDRNRPNVFPFEFYISAAMLYSLLKDRSSDDYPFSDTTKHTDINFTLNKFIKKIKSIFTTITETHTINNKLIEDQLTK